MSASRFRTSRCLVIVLSALFAASPVAAKSRTAPSGPYNTKSLSDCNDFISHEEIDILFQEIAQSQGDIATAFSIGRSVEGREIFALRLSATASDDFEGPRVRLIGGIHGNECMAVQLVTEFAVWLSDGYGDDPFVTRFLDEAEVVMVPVVNPDGYTGAVASRTNANGVDLNRNLHFAWIGVGDHPFSEPETRAIRDLSDLTAFTVGISYHTAAPYVNAPWNYSPYHPPDEALFQAMGEAYAGASSYNVVFGWDWYNIEGDVNDWSLGVKGTFDWTLELMSDLDPQLGVHTAGLEEFLSFAFQGIRGRVIDGTTGLPVQARVEVGAAGAPIFTHPRGGDYHRILLPGRYDIAAIAPGYEAMTVAGVEVPEDDVARVDFELSPSSSEEPEYAFSVNGMTLPEPVSHSVYQYDPYLNATMIWNALGPPDGRVYSLSPEGSITLDMGAAAPVADAEGPDLRVVAGDMDEDDAVIVLVAASQDGPFETVAQGTGTFEVDIATSGLGAVRFVRLVDDNEGLLFNAAHPGYDLDAVVNLSAGPHLDGDAGIPDTEVPDGGGAFDDVRATAWRCDCAAVGGKAARGATDWIEAILKVAEEP